MSTPIHSPANIRFLLDCHLSPEGHEPNGSPHSTDLVKQWLADGVIERYEPFDATPCTLPHYRATPLGRAWVQALCNVPLPKAAFVDDQGRIL